MRIYSFFVDSIEDGVAYIRDKKEISHLANVLRLKVGDRVRLVDGSYEYISLILSISKREVSFEILERKKDIYSLDRNICAIVGIVKPKAMSEIVLHLTEIGINSLIPLKTEFSFSNFNTSKWENISKEAAKQSLSVKSMQINDIIGIEDINFNKYDLVIACIERKSSNLSSINKDLNRYKNICYIIGPEGGFSEKEKTFLESNATVIGLGSRVLRAETAAIVVGGYLANG